MTEQQRFDLYINNPALGIIRAAELILIEQHQRLSQAEQDEEDTLRVESVLHRG